jgi:hypothetical protein
VSLIDTLPEDQRKRARPAAQPEWVPPMLATLTEQRFSDPNWIFERKFDGERCLAVRDGGEARLLSRNRLRMNDQYPEVAETLTSQEATGFVVDGEVVAFEGGRTSFALLQRRMHVRDPDAARRTGVAVYCYLFDLLYVDGHDVTGVGLLHRKALLRRLLAYRDPLRFTNHRTGRRPGVLAPGLPQGLGGCHRQAGRRALRAPPLPLVAEVQVRAAAGVRGRWLHRPAGLQARVWGAAARLLPGRGAGVRGQGGDGVRRADAHRPGGPAVLGGAERPTVRR